MCTIKIFHIETFSLQILITAKKKLFHEWFLCEQLRAHFPNSHLIITVILTRRELVERRNPQLSKLTLQFSYIAVHIKHLRGISESVWPDSWLQSHIAETAFTWPRYGVSVENNPRSVSQHDFIALSLEPEKSITWRIGRPAIRRRTGQIRPRRLNEAARRWRWWRPHQCRPAWRAGNLACNDWCWSGNETRHLWRNRWTESTHLIQSYTAICVNTNICVNLTRPSTAQKCVF